MESTKEPGNHQWCHTPELRDGRRTHLISADPGSCSLTTKILVLGPWRSNFGTLRSTEDCRQTTTICLLVRMEKKTQNFSSDAATNVVGTAKDLHVLKDS